MLYQAANVPLPRPPPLVSAVPGVSGSLLVPAVVPAAAGVDLLQRSPPGLPLSPWLVRVWAVREGEAEAPDEFREVPVIKEIVVRTAWRYEEMNKGTPTRHLCM